MGDPSQAKTGEGLSVCANFGRTLNASSRAGIGCAILRAKNEPESIAKIHEEKNGR
jgi:hypothetical protein